MKKQVPLCKLHPDFHLPEDVAVGEGFDALSYVRRLKKCLVDEIVFFAKCHYGYAYYPTRIGTVHPGLKNDMLGAMSKACLAEGMRLVAYYSVFLDSAAVRKNHDWTIHSQNTDVDAGFSSKNFLPICVNSPYLDELFIPQTIEVLKNYNVQEMFYDTMTGFHPCYCKRCRDAYGKDIPSNKDADWLEYVKWYRDCYENFFTKASAAVHQARPDVDLVFNWEWSYKRPGTPVPHITRLAGDLFPTGKVASQASRYWDGTGYPFDYMCGRFLHGLGDWNNSTPETLKYTAAATIANGGGFYLIDRQLPDGTLEERSYRIVDDVFKFMDDRREVVTGTTAVPEIAVLYPFDHINGPDLRYFPDIKSRQSRVLPFEGLGRLMMDRARHYTAFNEPNFLAHLKKHRLAILPELEFIRPEIKQGLRQFVENGGTALITQCGSHEEVDPEILDLAGVDYEGHSTLEYGYLDTPEPMLTYGRFAFVTPRKGTEVLCSYVPPMAAGKGGAQFGHGFAPPSAPDGHAAVVQRRLGKGSIIYVSAPLFASHMKYPNRDMAELILGWIDRLLPDPVVKVTTPAHVEMSVRRRGKDLIVHLVNHSGIERLGNYWAPATEYIPHIEDIRVAVRSLADGVKVRLEPSGQPVTADGGCVVVGLDIMQSLVVEGYFK